MQQPLAQTAPVKGSDLAGTNRGGKLPTERPQTIQQPGTSLKQPLTTKEEVWVKKWVDYSSKYGLGYYLSNDATGVFFNDSTKIALDPNGYHFDYYERKGTDR